jgi:hypothetical protein
MCTCAHVQVVYQVSIFYSLSTIISSNQYQRTNAFSLQNFVCICCIER